MSRHKDDFSQSAPGILHLLEAFGAGLPDFWLLMVCILALSTLACAFVQRRAERHSPEATAFAYMATHTPQPTFALTPMTPPLTEAPPTQAEGIRPGSKGEVIHSPLPSSIPDTLLKSPQSVRSAGSQIWLPLVVSSAGDSAPAPSSPSPPPPTEPARLAAVTPTTTATPEPAATPMPTSLPTTLPTPQEGGWSFVNLRLYTDQEDGLLLYGELLNETGASQALKAITGTFYDQQGQLKADESHIFAYWPVDIVPPGGRLPFGLVVAGLDQAADFDLGVEAEVTARTLRQDFEFSTPTQWQEGEEYCVEGELQNLGPPVLNNLVLGLILYDQQDRLVNFESDKAANPAEISGDETWAFEICVDSPNQGVTRYELRAWGF